MEMFPSDAGISEMRGVLRIVRHHGNKVSLSALAGETQKDIDELLPIVEACLMLGYIKVSNGGIMMTKHGQKIHFDTFQSIIKNDLTDVEPFKTTLNLLKKGPLSTRALSSELSKKGIRLRYHEKENEDMLRHLLLKWGVRTRLLVYEIKRDKWSVRR